MANNFIRERATESKTIHILQHLGQWLSLSAFFWYRIAAVVFNIPLSYGLHPPQLLICVSVRRHKQGFMQRQHFSILFLNQLIINIDHWWLPYYLILFPIFSYPHSFFPLLRWSQQNFVPDPTGRRRKWVRATEAAAGHSLLTGTSLRPGTEKCWKLRAVFLWYNSTALMAH